MFNNWANDSEVTKTLTWDPHKTIDVTKEILTSWINRYNDPTFYQFGIELKDNHQLIGTITGSDVSNESIEIGYALSKKYWNKGITTEATKAVINYFFKDVKIPKIIGIHLINNPASGKVMLKCGLKHIYDYDFIDKFNNKTKLCYYEIKNV